MGDMAMDAHDPNAMTVPAGETHELTRTFTEAGDILMGCHVPGHYAAGMRGMHHHHRQRADQPLRLATRLDELAVARAHLTPGSAARRHGVETETARERMSPV